MTEECEQTRIVKRKCKTMTSTTTTTTTTGHGNGCKYSKAESWSPCENGMKSKTFVLESSGGGDCEPNKIVKRACQQNRNKNGVRKGQRGRNKGKKERQEKGNHHNNHGHESADDDE